MTMKFVDGHYVQVHDRDYAYNEDENQAGIRHCSHCGKTSDHPIEEAIQVKVGEVCTQ